MSSCDFLLFGDEGSKVMELAVWKAMLERRGYQVVIRELGNTVEYDLGFMCGQRPLHALRRMTYRGLRKQIDGDLGHGMQHCLHLCGFPVLKAPAGYICNDPFYRVEKPFRRVRYYAVPLLSTSESLSVCPHCGGSLDGKTVHRVTDLEGQD